MLETITSIDYDPEKIAIELGQYARLRRKVSGMDAQALQASPDYRNILRIESSLKKLNLSGDQLLELSDYIIGQSSSMVMRQDIESSEPYRELNQEKEELERKLAISNSQREDLVKRLREALKPFEKVISQLAEILKDSS